MIPAYMAAYKCLCERLLPVLLYVEVANTMCR